VIAGHGEDFHAVGEAAPAVRRVIDVAARLVGRPEEHHAPGEVPGHVPHDGAKVPGVDVIALLPEQHLAHHDLGHRPEIGEPDGGQLRRARCPVGDEAMEHLDHVGVARDDPRVQVRIPVDGILGAQTVVERIRIREDLRIEQVVEAERGIQDGGAGGSGRRHHAEVVASMRGRIARSTSAASVSTVG